MEEKRITLPGGATIKNCTVQGASGAVHMVGGSDINRGEVEIAFVDGKWTMRAAPPGPSRTERMRERFKLWWKRRREKPIQIEYL